MYAFAYNICELMYKHNLLNSFSCCMYVLRAYTLGPHPGRKLILSVFQQSPISCIFWYLLRFSLSILRWHQVLLMVMLMLIAQVLIMLTYCWCVLCIHLPCNTQKTQSHSRHPCPLALIIFLSPLLQYSLSLRCRGSVVHESTG